MLPTAVFWPGEFHKLYGPWGREESDTAEQLALHNRAEGENHLFVHPPWIPGLPWRHSRLVSSFRDVISVPYMLLTPFLLL